ncbi:UDP-N-acetyl-alpha-D-glucosamine C6 dehydratase [Legionella massiliensis]|uniref:UDP-N-acetyl-alpha-D-glucosamine C6 dehydratase n=2 Tax=Legionella massiliensis TaxID=1034943 RepID=A0A078KW76_9GAMM|nr:UDP-N-acetyl-alpha-D-glucosamine C6 dehydratase [Legionella massiliensis]CEE14453.1 UDP-N-acetyl-alpha-D-glucosamine C6 dehydratase [Legionella massiliensis]
MLASTRTLLKDFKKVMLKINSFFQKFYKKLPALAYDLAAIPLAWYCAYWLRFNMQPFPPMLVTSYSLASLSVLTLVQIVSYYYFKVYRGLWRFSSLNDVARIIKATLSATMIAIPLLYLSTLLHHIPRSVFPLYAMILIILLCSARLVMRSIWEQRAKVSVLKTSKRVLIIGAGQAGESLVRDLKRTQSYLPVGLIDDSLSKRGMDVHGVRVLGTTNDLTELALRHRIDLILIAIPSARSALMRRIVDQCEGCNIPFRTLPSISALADGRVEVNALREVNIEDLLGRDQVRLEWDKIAASIKGKRVVVTGGGGSIGSELCRQVMALKPSKLLIIENCEFNLYKIEGELRSKFPDITLELGLVSVTDKVAVDYFFHQFQPQVVFHAAAYKHVPMLEEQVRGAVQNNVLGTQIVAEASIAIGAEKFILISTDKAVNPTNVMGTTKRVAEIYCQNMDRLVETQFITVRFGNVLNSAGSVVPLFQRQLQAGGPITVTHPDIQRYFMTIPEACQLILQAMSTGSGGEIFVLDMGEPIKISYLAEQMIRLAGKEPGKDVTIEYIGLRPGEKLYEELFHDMEQLAPTEHEKLFKAKFRQLEWSELTQAIRLLDSACASHSIDELYLILKNLVPEFSTKLELID